MGCVTSKTVSLLWASFLVDDDDDDDDDSDDGNNNASVVLMMCPGLSPFAHSFMVTLTL